MARFALRRLLSMVAVLFAISVLTFLIFEAIPNDDPAQALAGRIATPAQVDRVRQEWGFDKPIYVQYFRMMEKVFDGSVISYSQQLNVEQQIWRDLPATISLTVGAAILWFTLGVLFGTLSAVSAGKGLDRGLTVVAMIGVSTPVFLLGTLMIYYLGYKLEWFPSSGYVPLTTNPWQWFTHLIMPWVALSVLYVGIYSRIVRSSLLETMGQDFVRAARAKGLSERQTLIRHSLRNSLLPVLSLWGLDIAAVLGGGAILTESVFNLQGVGQYAADSIARLDVPPILVITLFGATVVVILSALTDILYAALDPRIRLT